MRIIQGVLHKKLLNSDVSAEIAYAGSILQACCQRIMFVRTCSGFCLYNCVFDYVYVQVDFVYITLYFMTFMYKVYIYRSIQGVSRLVDITAGGDFLGLCDQKISYKHVSDFGRLRSYDRLKVRIEGKDY
jgi:hypothetical protein